MISILLFGLFAVNNGQLQQPLRQAASGTGVFVGTALAYGDLTSDSQYATVGSTQYDLVTAENACKFGPTEPQQNVYSYTQCDYVYNFAKQHTMTFRGHNLCWGEQNPSWLTNGGFNGAQLQQILNNHITNVVKHYGTEAYCWDVVNEAVSDSPSNGNIYKTNVWYPAVPNYVELAFQYAKAANANVKLFYNDYNIIMSNSWMKTKADAVYNMIQNLTRSGVKVDGIGFQAHLSVSDWPLDYNGMVSNFQRFAALGLEIHITEMDVANPNNDQNTEALVYQTVLRACRAVSACKSFESWGFTDKYTWLGSSQHPLPFDANFNPKQAAYAIEQELLNKSASYPQRM